MTKYQKPIRSAFEELYDVDMGYQQKEDLQKTYADFWALMPKELGEALDIMLL